jgi:hypothetical protein
MNYLFLTAILGYIALSGPSTPNDYPPAPPKGPNGPCEPKGKL